MPIISFNKPPKSFKPYMMDTSVSGNSSTDFFTAVALDNVAGRLKRVNYGGLVTIPSKVLRITVDGISTEMIPLFGTTEGEAYNALANEDEVWTYDCDIEFKRTLQVEFRKTTTLTQQMLVVVYYELE